MQEGGRESPTRRYTIGANGSPWTPATAREEAIRLLILVARGIDPMEEDKKRRREAVDLAFSQYADTFSAACRRNSFERVSRDVLRTERDVGSGIETLVVFIRF